MALGKCLPADVTFEYIRRLIPTSVFPGDLPCLVILTEALAIHG